MNTREKYELAAKVWSEMYSSNFYDRSLEKQRKFADGLYGGLVKAGLIDKEK